jgi:hypothetical protein
MMTGTDFPHTFAADSQSFDPYTNLHLAELRLASSDFVRQLRHCFIPHAGRRRSLNQS